MTNDIIKNKNQFDKDTLMFKNYADIKVKCKWCGHIHTIPAFLDEKLCRNCGRMIINNTASHFKYKMRQELKEKQ